MPPRQVYFYDKEPIQPNVPHRSTFTDQNFNPFNVWGLKNGWQSLIEKADKNQPDKEFYHGITKKKRRKK